MANNGDTPSDSILPDGVSDHPTIELLREKYHIPVLVLVFVYMLSVRLQSFGRFATENGVYFSGNDPWYHYRMVKYTVAHWPWTMPFDPWTGYPQGSDAGHFGTLFDQILATVALIVGLGNPTDQTVRLVMIVAPPVLGALSIIPVYYLGRHLHSRVAGLFGVVALALTPGVFLSRSLVGVADHNIAEPLFMSLAVLALVVAYSHATREVIIPELLTERDLGTLREAFGPSVVAGIAMALYLFVWPPGLLLVGIAAVFYTAYAIVGSLSSRTIEPVLLVGVVSNVALAFLLLIKFETFQMSTTALGISHFGLALGTALGCAFLIAVSRIVEQRDAPKYAFGGIVIGTGLVAVAALMLLVPDALAFLWNNLIRVVGFGQHAGILTIGEGQPFVNGSGFFPTVLYSYGMLFFTAALGLVMLAGRGYRRFRDGGDAATDLFFVIWAVFMGLAAFTQVRFNYYLALVVAVLVGYVVVSVFERANVHETFPRLEAYQYVTLILVLAIVFVPVLMYPLGGSALVRAQSHDVGDYTAWEEPLEWMEGNSPPYDSLELYGTYSDPESGSFDYQSDVYGVMSWWDYGHYMTTTAERIPVANPFQQHARESAQFLLAENESEAHAVLDQMGAENVRYVVVDWKMVAPTSKFGAPVVWHPGLNQSDMYDGIYLQNADGSLQYGMTTMKQRYYESMMVRMYHYHGSAAQPGSLVVDYEKITVRDRNGNPIDLKVAERTGNQNKKVIQRFNNSQSAAQFIQKDGSAHYGGVGLQPRETVSALEHYRLVKTSQKNSFTSGSYMQSIQQYARFGNVRYDDFSRNPSWVKVFERVPGATVNGDGAPANSTVLAQVPMHDPTQNSTFMYRQFVQTNADGEFTLTVPYSTTGYDNYGPENGYTNVSVRAEGPYEFISVQQQIVLDKSGNQSLSYSQWYGTADVPEGAVNGETNETVTVTLEEQTDN